MILFRDKHTRIEGLCTENLFLNELIKNTFNDFSIGWWFRLKNNSYKIIKFLSSIAEIKDVDIFILDYFKGKGVNTFIVSFDDSEKDFFYLNYSQIQSNRFLNDWDKFKIRFPKSKNFPPIPKEAERNKYRLEQAIDLYTKNEYRNQLNWIGIKFTSEILSNSPSLAPLKTSIFGSNYLRYYHISPKFFHFIKKLGNEKNDNLINFINGNTKPLNSLTDLKII
ncbi:MAG: hypothetical protein ACE5JB_08985 [bacterium]